MRQHVCFMLCVRAIALSHEDLLGDDTFSRGYHPFSIRSSQRIHSYLLIAFNTFVLQSDVTTIKQLETASYDFRLIGCMDVKIDSMLQLFFSKMKFQKSYLTVCVSPSGQPYKDPVYSVPGTIYTLSCTRPVCTINRHKWAQPS